MLGPPEADPIDIRRTAEVVPIARLGQPATLTGRLARPPALRFPAVALVVRVACIGMEQFTAVQALASSSTFHLGNPPSYPKHRRRAPSVTRAAAAEEDAEQHAEVKEDEIEKVEEEDGRRDPPQLQAGRMTTVSARR
jgi:hypothetical protein